MIEEKREVAQFEFSESENSKFIFHGPAWRYWFFKVELFGWLLVQLARVRFQRAFRNLKNRFLI